MKKLLLALLFCFLSSNLLAYDVKSSKAETIKPYYQGKVLEVRQGGGYTYLRVKEKSGKSFWAVVGKTDVKVGDFVRFQKEFVAKNFNSKALNRSFDELMFADNIQKRVTKGD